MSPHGNLYRLARWTNTADAVIHPKRLPNRAKNIVVGRLLARTGVWRRIWGG